MSKDKKESSGFDDLLKEARAAIDDIDETRSKAKSAFDDTALGQVSKQVTAIHKTFNQVAQAGMWVYNNIIDPVVSSKWAGWPFRAYGRLWNAVVYAKDDNGEPVFSKKRAGLLLCATLAAGMNIQPITSTVAGTVWDAGWMATTTRTETWYLGKSQEIYPDANIFATQGCETVNCNDQNSIYFRIRPSIMNHAWKYTHDGSAFFSDFIAAAIPNDTNKCDVTYYGTRAKLFVRGFDIYPQILSVKCSPLTAKDLSGDQQSLNTIDSVSGPLQTQEQAPYTALAGVLPYTQSPVNYSHMPMPS